MSRRGWNLKSGTPERARADAKIRARAKGKTKPQPEAEAPIEDGNGASLDGLSEVERTRLTWAMHAARAQHFAVPTIDSSGRLVARPLDEDLVLPWEPLDAVAAEVPDYIGLGWYVEETEIGVLLHGPGRLPQIVAEDEILPAIESVPSNGAEPEPEPEPVDVTMVDDVAVIESA